MDSIEYARDGSNLQAVKDWLGPDMFSLDSDGAFGVCIGDGSSYIDARRGDTLERDERGDVVVTAFAR